MTTITTLRKRFIVVLLGIFLTTSLQTPAMADMIGNEQLALEAELQVQRDEVRSFLARDDVRAALLDYGVDAKDVDTRINSMTEAELLRIQHQLEQMPAGGDGGILGAILLVILIFLLLDIGGITDVFPGV